MDRNFLLAFALSMLVITLWMSLQSPPEPPVESPAGAPVAESPNPAVPGAVDPSASPAIPDWEPAPAPGSGTGSGSEVPFAEATPAPTPAEASSQARIVRVSTPLFDVELSSLGGTISGFALREYREHNGPDAQPVALVKSDVLLPPNMAALATPFGELGVGNLAAIPFDVSQPDPLTTIFSVTQNGVTLIKTYRFASDSYAFAVDLEVRNGTPRVLEPIFEAVWPGLRQETPDFEEFSLVALRDEDLEQMLIAGRGPTGCGPGGGDDPKTFSGGVRWAGVQTRYFVAAMVPEVAGVTSARFLPNIYGEIPIVSIGQGKIQLGPGASHRHQYRVYVGPKETERLTAGMLADAQLDRAVQLGWSWIAPLTRFFNWLLHELYAYIPNYGWVIILITVMVRVVTAPLLGRQMRSMKKMSTQMQEIKPRLDAIKEKYGDDRQKLSEETMNAYREAGINPLGMLGGCLPMLLQFPVFIGLFYALQSSIDLRQAPFIAWMDDLSVPEALFVIPGLELPFRVLPLVMGASMYLQQKLTPQTSMDPAQQQMMLTIMPVMFTVLFYQFPSGLVLYWMVSNLLAIAHQAWINRTTPQTA